MGRNISAVYVLLHVRNYFGKKIGIKSKPIMAVAVFVAVKTRMNF